MNFKTRGHKFSIYAENYLLPDSNSINIISTVLCQNALSAIFIFLQERQKNWL